MAMVKKFGSKKVKENKELPDYMSERAKEYFWSLQGELKDLGVDTNRYHRAIVLLAKDLALEEMCERDVNEQGSVCYSPPSGASKLLKDHPSAKNLHTVRNRIYMLMKAMGMLPNTRDSSNMDRSESDFAAFG